MQVKYSSDQYGWLYWKCFELLKSEPKLREAPACLWRDGQKSVIDVQWLMANVQWPVPSACCLDAVIKMKHNFER